MDGKKYKLEVVPQMEPMLIKDLVLLLLKKGIITPEDINGCQRECECEEENKGINYMLVTEEQHTE